jgi:hypothetical protein
LSSPPRSEMCNASKRVSGRGTSCRPRAQIARDPARVRSRVFVRWREAEQPPHAIVDVDLPRWCCRWCGAACVLRVERKLLARQRQAAHKNTHHAAHVT